jgi:alpha-tubulin suppressor-like RCC1 family protein
MTRQFLWAPGLSRKKLSRNGLSRTGLGLAALAAVTLTGQSSQAAQAGGSLQAWGMGISGQLGNGTIANSDRPVTVDLPSRVTITAVAGGGKHTLALTSAGQVLAWGSNYHGELGNGTNSRSSTPVAVHLPKGTVVTAIAAGDGTSMALTSAGQVYAWGANQYGQLGDGSTQQTSTPVAVLLPRRTKVVAIGTSYNYSVALTADGHVLTWGYNGSGQLGNGFETASEIPVRVRLPKGVTITAIANGGYDCLALTSKGSLMAWGAGGWGQLGNGSTSNAESPVTVRLPKGARIVAIAGGSQHSLALTSTGEVLAWGRGDHGQLGDGSTASADLPVRVKIAAGDHVTAIGAGGGFSLALTSTGRELAWGHNQFGQLGDGSFRNTDLPVPVLLPAGLIAIRLPAGPTTRHSLAIVRRAAA